MRATSSSEPAGIAEGRARRRSAGGEANPSVASIRDAVPGRARALGPFGTARDLGSVTSSSDCPSAGRSPANIVRTIDERGASNGNGAEVKHAGVAAKSDPPPDELAFGPLAMRQSAIASSG